MNKEVQKEIRIIILAVVFLFVFCWVRDFFIRSLIGSVATRITGAPTSVGGLSFSIIRQSVRISDFRMYNPEGFEKDIFVDIPKINLTYNLGALLTGKIHIRQLEVEIKEVGMVRNKKGKLNVDSLKMQMEKPAEKEKKKPAKRLAMRIDTVKLGMGRVVSRNYSVEGPPVINVYEINLKKTYKNITSAQQLVILLIAEPLKATGIEGLKMYGASVLTGVAALPIITAFTLTSKDYVQETFNVTAQRAYDAGLQAVRAAGKVKKEDRGSGVIGAEVSGARVTLKIKKISESSIQVTISARKFGLPRVNTASGVMSRLREQLK